MRFLILVSLVGCAPLTLSQRRTLEAEHRFDSCQRLASTPGELRRCFYESRDHCLSQGLSLSCGTTGYVLRAGGKR